MKILKTKSSEIVMECQNYFGFYTVSTLIMGRKQAPVQVDELAERTVRIVQCRCA